jgi:hypothetical protein
MSSDRPLTVAEVAAIYRKTPRQFRELLKELLKSHDIPVLDFGSPNMRCARQPKSSG